MSEVHFLFRRKVARQGRPCTSRRERDCIRPVHRASVIDAERDRIDRNEVTMRVVICMSRAATLYVVVTKSYGRGVDKTFARAGQRLADDYTIASSPRCISRRSRILYECECV